ncbi:MAG: hypothetical protein ACYC54_10380 [Sedimentisphaerales bacterium]
MFNKTIRTIEDVEQFFDYLVKILHLNFHPDTDFLVYINIETKVNTFSQHDAKKLNSTMAQCFNVCEAAEKDIYRIGINSLCGQG